MSAGRCDDDAMGEMRSLGRLEARAATEVIGARRPGASRILTCGCLRKATALEIMSSRSAPEPEPPVTSSFVIASAPCEEGRSLRSLPRRLGWILNTSPVPRGSGINWPSPPLNPLLTSHTRGFTAREHRAFEDEHLRERVARPARPRRALRRARRRRRGPRLDAHEPRRRRRESSVAARRPRGFGTSRAPNSRHRAPTSKIASPAADARARQRGPRPRRGARRVRHDLRHRALPGPGVQAGGVQGPGRLLLLRRPPLRRHPGVPGMEARPAHALRPAPHRGHRRRLRVGSHRTAPGDPRPRARRRGRRHRRTRRIRARDELGTPGRQRSAWGQGFQGRGGTGTGTRRRTLRAPAPAARADAIRPILRRFVLELVRPLGRAAAATVDAVGARATGRRRVRVRRRVVVRRGAPGASGWGGGSSAKGLLLRGGDRRRRVHGRVPGGTGRRAGGRGATGGKGRAPAGSVGGGSKYDDSFGPGRFVTIFCRKRGFREICRVHHQLQGS